MIIDNIKENAKMIAIEIRNKKEDNIPFLFKDQIEITVNKSGDKNEYSKNPKR